MNISNLLKLAFRSILRNKLRTFLTTLGIIIGVSSVIVMLAIGNSSDKSIRGEIEGLGTNVITVNSGTTSKSGVRQESGSNLSLRPQDALAIKKYCNAVAAASPIVTSRLQGIAGSRNWRGPIYGVTADYFEIANLSVLYGTLFNNQHENSTQKVCIIGTTVAKDLFGENVDPTGRIIRLDKVPFKIIGVLKSKGQGLFGIDRDDIIFAPFFTVQKRFLNTEYAQQILVSSIDENSMENAVEQIESTLINIQKRVKNDEATFVVRTQKELSSIFGTITGVLTGLLAGIAFISLLVGGIGIMNIMLVSVTERTREIGTRLAVGAKPKNIMQQFLIESVILCLTGGLIGVSLGILIAYIFSSVMGWPLVITANSVIMAFVFSSAVGVFFGYYPARKASKLNPVEALRYE